MTTEHYDGIIATHPDMLDTRPSVATQLGDIMDRAIDGIDSPASFIPAVHSAARDEALRAMAEWRDHEQHGRDAEADEALLRLRDVADRWLGGAA